MTRKIEIDPSILANLTRRAVLSSSMGLGVIAAAGCGGSDKPAVGSDNRSTAHKVLPPPTMKNGKPVGNPSGGRMGKGTMSAREFREYRKKQMEQP